MLQKCKQTLNIPQTSWIIFDHNSVRRFNDKKRALHSVGRQTPRGQNAPVQRQHLRPESTHRMACLAIIFSTARRCRVSLWCTSRRQQAESRRLGSS